MKRLFFTLVLPALWVSVSFVSYFHPGDEYAIYGYSNIIGVWPFFLFQPPDVHGLLFPTMVAVTGGISIAVVGLGLDKLQVNRRLWGVLWIVISTLLFVFSVSQYPTIQKALSKNGSWTAYIAGAMNCGLYFSVLLSAVFRITVSLIRRIKGKNH